MELKNGAGNGVDPPIRSEHVYESGYGARDGVDSPSPIRLTTYHGTETRDGDGPWKRYNNQLRLNMRIKPEWS